MFGCYFRDCFFLTHIHIKCTGYDAETGIRVLNHPLKLKLEMNSEDSWTLKSFFYEYMAYLHCWSGCLIWVQTSGRSQQSCELTSNSPDPAAWTPPGYCHSPVTDIDNIMHLFNPSFNRTCSGYFFQSEMNGVAQSQANISELNGSFDRERNTFPRYSPFWSLQELPLLSACYDSPESPWLLFLLDLWL